MTHDIPNRYGAFPNRDQELFLRAALLPGDAGSAAWREWKQRVAWERDMDAASFALLPLLYHHLKELGVEDPAMGRFKGVYRKVWYQNRTLLHETAEILRLFEAGGIDTMVLKGAALTRLYYQDFGLRKMHDLDVVVPPAKRREAIDALSGAGWTPKFRPLSMLTDANLDLQHGWAFTDGRERQLDLHWRVLPGGIFPDAEEGFWAASVPLDLEGVATKTLCPTDLLLHTFAHGIRWSPIPPIRWVADSIHILRGAQGGIDWERLTGWTENCRLVLPVREGLACLRESFGADIPDGVLRELNAVRIPPLEQRHYACIVAPQSVSLGELPVYWYEYLLNREAAGRPTGLRAALGFLPYLRRFKMMTWREFLGWIVTRLAVRISRSIRGRADGEAAFPEESLL